MNSFLKDSQQIIELSLMPLLTVLSMLALNLLQIIIGLYWTEVLGAYSDIHLGRRN